MEKKPQKIVLASGNAKKVAELQALLAPLAMEVIPQTALGIPDADESGLSFVENAIIKARHASRLSQLPAIADDSGLEVDALDGAPGIYSARFAGEPSSNRSNMDRNNSDQNNNVLLLDKLRGIADSERSARFQCVLVFMRHADDPTPLICSGSWEGRILDAPRGNGGFGYDPLFFLPQQNCSAAELAPADKARLSHRGQAMGRLLRALEQRYG